MRTIGPFILSLSTLVGATSAAWCEPDVQQTTETFLHAYAAGDAASAEAALEPDVHMYGSDIAESYTGLDGFRHIFANDMKLWNGKAKFGALQNVSIARDANLAAIFFDAPFTVGTGPAVMVRFAMVWRLENGAWKLAKSSNCVPTVGQSGDELLRPKK